MGLDPEETLESPSWAGLPPISWDAPAGFAAACGMSTQSGQGMLRDALILRHRLPRTWGRVLAGEVPAWRARMIAQEVAGAPEDVVEAMDCAVAPIADRAGQVTLRRLVDEVMVVLYPEHVEAASLEALDRRYVRFERGTINHTGIAAMDIRADYADLHEFDATLDQIAAVLDRLDPDAQHEPHQVRRARALGVLADPDLARELLIQDSQPTPDSESSPEDQNVEETGNGLADSSTNEQDSTTGGSHRQRRRPGARSGTRSRVRLELRITDLALLGLDPVGECRPDDGEGFVTLSERIAAWCGRTASEINVVPVLDPDAHRDSDAYQVRGALREHIDRRDRHCLFPFCTRPARACDHDHVVPDGQGGASCTCNLVPLCRHHHRLKTKAGYRSTVVEPGVVWWRTPHGHEFLTDSVGTLPLHRAPPTGDGCLLRSG